jgi:DNA-binding transcriptional regulator GbsR (MarR family)
VEGHDGTPRADAAPPVTRATDPERPADHTGAADADSLFRFVERFAVVLQGMGMPRMPARTFAYVLADDAESYTAAELAAGLRVSPAAVSGATRYLVGVGLLGRERRPGSRSDHYRVYDEDVWSAITMQRIPLLDRNVDALAEGIKLLDPRTAGGRRVQETLEFFRFLRGDLPHLLDRWREHRRRHQLGRDHD